MFFQGNPSADDDEWEDEEQNNQGTQPNEPSATVNTTEFYQLLEITKDATTQHIKKAFRRRALKEHPDKGGDPNKFKRLKEAYDTLLDPEKRQLYDEYGEEGVKNGGAPGGGDFFNFFGGAGKKDNRPKKMKPKLVEVQVTLQQVFSGVVKQIKVTRSRICVDCQGKGGSNVVKCETCKGNGITMRMTQLGPGMFTQVQAPCDKCKATGEVVSQQNKCKTCQGKKVKEQEKVMQVVVEPGVPDSHDYIFHGESDEYPGVMSGDVFARISIIKHQVFERRGADLVHHQQISLLEALTGVTKSIHHLDGKEYLIATAPGQILENKELKTIRRLGMPFYKDEHSRGNLYFEFKVVFPAKSNISADQEKLLREAFDYNSQNTGLQSNQEAAPLSDYAEQELNPKAGIQDDQDDQEQGQGQGIPCQQQ